MSSDKQVLYPEFEAGITRRLKDIHDGKALPANKKTIDNFVTHCRSRGLSSARVCFFMQRLHRFAAWSKKDFKSLTKGDIDAFMASVSGNLGKWGRDGYVVSLHTLYRFIYSVPLKAPMPDCSPVKNLPRSKGKTKIHKKMLFTAQEVKAIMEAASSPMWRCAFAVMAETGVRPGEVRSIKLGDVELGSNMITIHISGGKMEDEGMGRDVFVIDNHGDLATWMRCHPRAGKMNAWLFEEEGKPIRLHALTYELKSAAARAGINGRSITAYLFRHTKLTELYQKFPTEMARRLAGHAPSSTQPATYTHIDTDDLKHMLLSSKGINTEAEKLERALYMMEQFARDIGQALKLEQGGTEEVIDAMRAFVETGKKKDITWKA